MSTRNPVLLLAYNRPEAMLRSLEAIDKADPPRVYIAIDGPKSNDAKDRKQVVACVKIARERSSASNVSTLIRDSNLGCGVAISSAIDWFFQAEAQGIILEDDLVPTENFFEFVDEALEIYRRDVRVLSIGGFNAVPPKSISSSDDIRFSRFPQIWGWATWRDRWQSYQYELPRYPTGHEFIRVLRWCNYSAVQTFYWLRQFRRVRDRDVDTWDYQLTHLAMRQGRVSVVPNVNLVENHGWGNSATHTRTKPRFLPHGTGSIAVKDMPSFNGKTDVVADRWMSAEVFRSTSVGLIRRTRDSGSRLLPSIRRSACGEF